MKIDVSWLQLTILGLVCLLRSAQADDYCFSLCRMWTSDGRETSGTSYNDLVRNAPGCFTDSHCTGVESTDSDDDPVVVTEEPAVVTTAPVVEITAAPIVQTVTTTETTVIAIDTGDVKTDDEPDSASHLAASLVIVAGALLL